MRAKKSHTRCLEPGHNCQCFRVMTVMHRGCSALRVLPPSPTGGTRQLSFHHSVPQCPFFQQQRAPRLSLFLLARTGTFSWTSSLVSAHAVLLQRAPPLSWVRLRLWRNVSERLQRAALAFEGCFLWLWTQKLPTSEQKDKRTCSFLPEVSHYPGLASELHLSSSGAVQDRCPLTHLGYDLAAPSPVLLWNL